MSDPARDVSGWAMVTSLAVVVLFVSCCCEGACPEVERRALLELKHSINHPSGTSLPTWGGHAGDGNCCRWPGITCDNSTGRVIEVNLSGQRAFDQGQWYPNLTMLVHMSELQRLDLSDTRLGGWAFAQALCELKQLRVLDLGSNSLHGIPPKEFYVSLCQMSSLTGLFLRYNEIEGTFPPCLCNASSLRVLALHGNRLQGYIPPCLGNLYSLKYLVLYDNEFVGDIPPSIFHNLTNLRDIWIRNDELVGTLELSVLANLSKLKTLVLFSHYELEIETESSSWVPSFQLEDISIQQCPINKRSGHGVPSFISTQHHLTSLHLNDDSLAGRLPSWLFCNSSLQSLLLEWNNFDDMFPQPCHNSSSAIEILYLAGNGIHGSLPNGVGFQFWVPISSDEISESQMEQLIW